MELGREFEEHIAAGLAERVEELAAERAAQVYQESERTRQAARAEQSGRVRQFVLGIISLAMGVPITGIAATTTEPNSLMGVAIAWGGIVGVNAVHALSTRSFAAVKPKSLDVLRSRTGALIRLLRRPFANTLCGRRRCAAAVPRGREESARPPTLAQRQVRR